MAGLFDFIPDAASQFIKGFVGTGEQTGEDFKPQTVDVLRQAAMNALAEGRTNIDYEDYPDVAEGLTARELVSDSEARGGFMNVLDLISNNPVADAAYSVGGATIKIKDGDVYLTDLYDFSKISPGNVKDFYGALRFAAGQFSPDDPNKVEIKLGSEKELMGYEVKKGDTLSKIAKQMGYTVEELAQANNIKDVNKIKIGQRIKAPVFTPEPVMSEMEVAYSDLLDGDQELIGGA